MSVKLFGGNQWIDLKQWSFPGGERGVTVVEPNDILRILSFTIVCNFKGSDDLIDIALLVNACRNISSRVSLRLRIPYFPYARQDRVTGPGEAFALQVAAKMISDCKFTQVEVWDAHSDVLSAFFEPGILLNKPQHELIELLVEEYIKDEDVTALVAPDAGALKKIYPLAVRLGLPVIEAKKIRNVSTGKIEKSSMDTEAILKYNSLIVVDDICDGGATFIQLGSVIREIYDGRLALFTTHGIYSKGIKVLWEHYDTVNCINNMEK